MKVEASTPEELETLLEDAFLARDPQLLISLFSDGALLVPRIGATEARGRHEIAGVAQMMWEGNVTYIASPRRVLQSRDTALVLADCSTTVMRRDTDGTWHYVIAMLTDRPFRAADDDFHWR